MFDASIIALITNIVRLRKPLIIRKKQHWQQVMNYYVNWTCEMHNFFGDQHHLSTIWGFICYMCVHCTASNTNIPYFISKNGWKWVYWIPLTHYIEVYERHNNVITFPILWVSRVVYLDSKIRNILTCVKRFLWGVYAVWII